VTKLFDNVVEEYVKFLNEKIKEGYKVKMKDKNVTEIELVKNKRGTITDYNVIVKYDDDTIEMMRATAFLEKLVELKR
jgi:hypothetical protein